MIGNCWNTCMYFLTANVMKCHEANNIQFNGLDSESNTPLFEDWLTRLVRGVSKT